MRVNRQRSVFDQTRQTVHEIVLLVIVPEDLSNIGHLSRFKFTTTESPLIVQAINDVVPGGVK